MMMKFLIVVVLSLFIVVCCSLSSSADAAFSGASTTSSSKLPSSSSAAAASATQQKGRVLAPKSNGEGWWDDECCANPIVIPPTSTSSSTTNNSNNKWKMFYYGRPNKLWKNNIPAFLPTGVSGMAVSDNGLHWERVKGPLEGGSILQPSSDDPNAFDCVQIGMTDVLRADDDGDGNSSYIGFYFGANNEETDFGNGQTAVRGFKMLPGIVTSQDGDGIHWERNTGAAAKNNNPILELGAAEEWDRNFCSWPRVVPIDPKNNNDVHKGEWLLTYHTLQSPDSGGKPQGWAVGAAISKSGCMGPYKKIGKILEGGADESSWDCKGIGTRHVVHDDDGKLVMIYEGVGPDEIHRLGLASSIDGGRTWQKARDLSDQPGGPIVQGRIGESDDEAWDNYTIGTPYLVRCNNNENNKKKKWRLYYVGAKPGSFAIGCMESDQLWSCDWERVDGTC